MSNLLFFEDDPAAPRIKNLSELPDDSSTHRWRAHWASDWEGNILGIDLVAYPVVSLTPQGAWIDPNAWREHGLSGPRWALTGQRRWVSNSDQHRKKRSAVLQSACHAGPLVSTTK